MARYVHIAENLPSKYEKLLIFAQLVLQSLTGNVKFPNAPGLDKLATVIKALHTALSKGTGAERKAAAEAVREVLGDLADWVEVSARAMVDTLDLSAIQAAVESTGFGLRKRSPRQKYVFGASYGPTTGSVDLTAPPSRARDPHEWQMSVNGKDWVSLPGTRKAKTRVENLPVGVTHAFRHRTLTKAGYTEWSDPVATIVVR